jgi:hypothetical protein
MEKYNKRENAEIAKCISFRVLRHLEELSKWKKFELPLKINKINTSSRLVRQDSEKEGVLCTLKNKWGRLLNRLERYTQEQETR